MDNQKMTYQERLQAAGQKHADKWNECIPIGNQLICVAENMTDESEVTVSLQTEALRSYFEQEVLPTLPDLVGIVDFAQRKFEKYLLEHGYIESKTKDDGR